MTYNFGKIKFEGNYLIEEQEVALDISIFKIRIFKNRSTGWHRKNDNFKAISKNIFT